MSETYYTNSTSSNNPYKLVTTSKSYAILEGADGEEISIIIGSLDVHWKKVKPMTWDELATYVGSGKVFSYLDGEIFVKYVGNNYAVIECVDNQCESILRNGYDDISKLVMKGL